MTISLWVIAAVTFVIVLFLWAGLTIIIPSSLRSIFRYRLWKLRDQMVDDLLAGRLPNSILVRDFIRIVEDTIVNAREVTLIRWLLMPVSVDVAKRYQQFLAQHIGELTEESKNLFNLHRQHFRHVVMNRLVFECMSGWVFLLLSFPVVIVVFCVKAARKASIAAVLSTWYYKRAFLDVFTKLSKRYQMTNERLLTFERVSDRNNYPPIACQL